MRIIESRVTAGDCEIFDLNEFLQRPLFAHLATSTPEGPRDSPVWFHWEEGAVWIIGGTSFPENLKRDPRAALGIVDFDRVSGRVHHVGFRGKATVLPFDPAIARKIFCKYFGPDETAWDPRFNDTIAGRAGLELVRFVPETAVVRDQSYRTSPRS